ncbi:uncharacterized protein LOC114861134 [Betta splendens]|uniref:Uncharacterized protein LOC114861134 n=1 Tax=Betta splendens TaxID=158456 RepID=A0A8M1HGT0_BETSP|nr:uncharacterized protein LOC114861134 [Betta splendens]
MRTTPEAANASRMSNQPKQAKITNKIDSVDDLKTINFRHSVPKHSLLLLHWFANTVKIEDDGIWLTFDPKRQYGSHGYGNEDGLLPVGRQYYAVGDLSRDKHEFPSYMYYELRENVGRNLDRIIFSVNEHGVENGAGSMVEEVYLTQHMANEYQEAAYDRGNTYLVTPNLLKQMQRFSELKQSLWILNSEFRSNATDFQLLDFYEQWSFPHLELLLFTVTKKTQFFQKGKRYRVAAHAATFPALHTGLGFAVGIPENTENQVNSECRGIPAGGLWDRSLQREPEVMTETEVKGRKVPTPNECQPTTQTATPSSQTTMYCVAVGIPTNQHDQKETEASEILQDQSNEVMTGAHEKGSRAWSNVFTRIKCQPATQAETSSSQTTVHSSKSSYEQKGSGGPVHSAGGLQVHSNETNGQKVVMTGGEEKNTMAQSYVSTRNKRVVTSSAQTTAPVCSVCIPENRDDQVMSEGSEIATGGLHDQSKETKAEAMSEAEKKDRTAGKNVPAENKCQPETLEATSCSQITGSERSTGGLQDQSNETRPEVMAGTHEKGSRTWSNVLTHFKCQPATQAETSSSQTTVDSSKNRYKQKESGGPVHSAGGLQVHSNETNGQKEVMTGGEEKNKMAQSNVSTHKRVDSSSCKQPRPLDLFFLTENRYDQVMGEGSERSTGGLHDQSKETKPEVMTEAEEKGRTAGKNVATENKCQPETFVATSRSQVTGSERSTGGLQDQSNGTRPEVMTGAHEKGSKIGAHEKASRAWSNVFTRFKCQPATHAETSSSQTTAPVFSVCKPENRDDQVMSEGSEIATGGLHNQSKETKPEVKTEDEEKGRTARKNVTAENKCQPETLVATSCSQITGSERSTGGLQDQSNETRPEVMTGAHEKDSKTGAHEKGSRAWSNVFTRFKCQPATHAETSSSQITRHSSKGRYKQKGSGGPVHFAGGLQVYSNETNGQKEVMTGGEEKNKMAQSNMSTRNKRLDTSSAQTTGPVCSICIPENRYNQVMSEGSEIATGGLHDQSKETKPEVMTEAEEKGRTAGKNVPAENECQPETLVATPWSQVDGSERSRGGLQDQSNGTRPEVMTGAHEKGSRTWSNVLTHFKCQPATYAETSSSRTTAPVFSVCIPENRDNQVMSEGSKRSIGGLQDQSNETRPEVTTGEHEKHRIVWSNMPTHHKYQPETHVATSSSQITALGCGCAVCIPEYEVMTEISTGGLQGQSDKLKPEGMTGADEMHKVIWINESQPAAHMASSSSQNAALAAGIPQHTQIPMDGEGSGIISEDLEVLQSGDIKLEVVTGTDGKARIVWSNTPSHPKKQDRMVVLFKSNEDKDASKSYEFIGCRESGSYDTTVPLNEGLQARMLNAKKWFFFWTGVGQEICRSVEFKNPEPVNISGHEAKLQLFVRDGKACVRLYVKKSFKAWKSEFKESWVGFYIFADTKNKEYRYWQWQWQWATKFKPCHDWEDSTYDVHEYDSGRAIAQGVQARFMLRDEVVKASTPSWK